MKELTLENKLDLIRQLNGNIEYDPKTMTKKTMSEVITMQQVMIHNIIMVVSNTSELDDLACLFDEVADMLEQGDNCRRIFNSNYFCLPVDTRLVFDDTHGDAYVSIPHDDISQNEKDVLAEKIRDLIRVIVYWQK